MRKRWNILSIKCGFGESTEENYETKSRTGEKIGKVINQNQQFEGRVEKLEAGLKRQKKANGKLLKMIEKLSTEKQVKGHLGVQKSQIYTHVNSVNNETTTQQAHDVKMTSDRRRCDVMTSHRR